MRASHRESGGKQRGRERDIDRGCVVLLEMIDNELMAAGAALLLDISTGEGVPDDVTQSSWMSPSRSFWQMHSVTILTLLNC